jgi:hypothetical protein
VPCTHMHWRWSRTVSLSLCGNAAEIVLSCSGEQRDASAGTEAVSVTEIAHAAAAVAAEPGACDSGAVGAPPDATVVPAVTGVDHDKLAAGCSEHMHSSGTTADTHDEAAAAAGAPGPGEVAVDAASLAPLEHVCATAVPTLPPADIGDAEVVGTPPLAAVLGGSDKSGALAAATAGEPATGTISNHARAAASDPIVGSHAGVIVASCEHGGASLTGVRVALAGAANSTLPAAITTMDSGESVIASSEAIKHAGVAIEQPGASDGAAADVGPGDEQALRPHPAGGSAVHSETATAAAEPAIIAPALVPVGASGVIHASAPSVVPSGASAAQQQEAVAPIHVSRIGQGVFPFLKRPPGECHTCVVERCGVLVGVHVRTISWVLMVSLTHCDVIRCCIGALTGVLCRRCMCKI